MRCDNVLRAILTLLPWVYRAHGSPATMSMDGHLSLLQQHATMNTVLNRSTGGGCASDDDCSGSSWRCCPSGGTGSPCKDTSGKDKKCTCVSQCSTHTTSCGTRQAASVNPTKKKVLLIGDSISVGYKEPVKELLGDSYEVHHVDSQGNSNLGAHCVNNWLSAFTEPFNHHNSSEFLMMKNSKWDLIAFNFGLHDSNDNVEYVGVSKYKKNLETLVSNLKKTGAHLLWLTTTPVSGACDEANAESRVKSLNSAAATLMSGGIGKCDLHQEVLKKCGQNYGSKKGGDCSISPCSKPSQCRITSCTSPHFTDAGYNLLAKKLAECVKQKLR